MVVPGSHKTFISCAGETPASNWESSLQKRQETGVPPGDLLRSLTDACSIKYCEAPAGSVIVFDSNLLHGSHSNVSPYSRMNAFYVFNAVSNVIRVPFAAPSERPEHIATRDPKWQEPLQAIRDPSYAAVRKQAMQPAGVRRASESSA